MERSVKVQTTGSTEMNLLSRKELADQIGIFFVLGFSSVACIFLSFYGAKTD